MAHSSAPAARAAPLAVLCGLSVALAALAALALRLRVAEAAAAALRSQITALEAERGAERRGRTAAERLVRERILSNAAVDGFAFLPTRQAIIAHSSDNRFVRCFPYAFLWENLAHNFHRENIVSTGN